MKYKNLEIKWHSWFLFEVNWIEKVLWNPHFTTKPMYWNKITDSKHINLFQLIKIIYDL
jgi:hypothetical protein